MPHSLEVDPETKNFGKAPSKKGTENSKAGRERDEQGYSQTLVYGFYHLASKVPGSVFNVWLC